MGCDIHIVCEIKERDEWKILPYGFSFRDYEVFSILAGVRGWHEPIAYPRGYPEDWTKEKRRFIQDNLYYKFSLEDDEDQHSASWLNFKEIFDDPRNRELEFLRLKLKECMDIDGYEDVDKYRMVFNFDN